LLLLRPWALLKDLHEFNPALKVVDKAANHLSGDRLIPAWG